MTEISIVGLTSPTNGRSCDIHGICGIIAKVDMVVKLKKVTVECTKGFEEPAIAAIHMSMGEEKCRIGFLPKQYVARADFYEGRLAQIIEIYNEDTKSKYKRKASYQNCGYCIAVLLTSKTPTINAAIVTPTKKQKVEK